MNAYAYISIMLTKVGLVDIARRYSCSLCTSETAMQRVLAFSGFNCMLLECQTLKKQRLAVNGTRLLTFRVYISTVPSGKGVLKSILPSDGGFPSESPNFISFQMGALRTSLCVPSLRRMKRAFFGSSFVMLNLNVPKPLSSHLCWSRFILQSLALPLQYVSSPSSPVSTASDISIS